MFRAQLILHDKVRAVFESSLRLARESGYLKKRGMRVALDTTNILGRGSVKDTFNLLADGIVKLMRAPASVEQTRVKEWLAQSDPADVALFVLPPEFASGPSDKLSLLGTLLLHGFIAPHAPHLASI